MSKNAKIILGIVIAVIVIAGIWYGTTRKPAEKGAIKIGVILHLTGDQAEPARGFQEGIILAADKINAEGGVNGKKIEVIIEDSKLQTKEAYTAAQKLIYTDKIVAGIDASFLEVMSNGRLFNDAKIPVITLWDSNKSIEDIGEFAFGIGIWTPSAGEKSAEFAYNSLHARNAAIIYTQNEWSQAVADYFKNKFENLGGKIVGNFSVLPSTSDFRTTITKAKDSGADAIYTPITDGIVQFYTQLRQLNIKVPIITSDIITNEHIVVAPSAFENIYQTQALDPKSEAITLMLEEYLKKYQHEAKQVLFISWGYDAINLLAEAVRNVGSDSVKIKDYLHSVKNYNGASGIITINERGSSPKLENMFRIKNGKFIEVE